MSGKSAEYGSRTDKGRIRDHNEDTLGVSVEDGLWIVADGMGGHEGGEQASAIARDEIITSIGNGLGITESIELAHTAIIKAASAGSGPAQMGSTIVALKTEAHNYVVAWVGDSRAYLWNGKLVQLSKDHSLVQSLIDNGKLDGDSQEAAKIKNVITQCLGPPNEGMPRIDTVSGSWHEGDKVLLCSDGLHGEVDDGVMGRIITDNGSSGDQAITEALVDAALQAGGSDNITAVVVSAPLSAPRQAPVSYGGKPGRMLLALVAGTALLLLLLFLYWNRV